MHPESFEGGPVGWTCPECEHRNLPDEVRCSRCGYERELDFPMDDELEEDAHDA